MSIIDSIDLAKKQNASDEEILGEIIKQNPEKISVFDEAQKRGATPSDILNEIRTQNQKKVRPEVSSIGKNAKEFGAGVLKGAGSTLYGVGQLGEKAFNVLSGRKETTLKEKPSILVPQTPAEKAGFAGEQIGEFFIPGGAISKGTKALESSVQAAKLAPKLEAGLKLGGKAAIEGVAGGAITAAQRGEFDKNTTDAAIISSLFPLTGAAYSKGKQIGKDFAPRIVNSLVKPLMKDFSYGANPGRAVAEEGIVANNLDELATKINSSKKRIGSEIGQITSQGTRAGKILDLSSALKPLDDAIAHAGRSPRTNAELISRLQNAKDDLLGKAVDEAGNVSFTRKLSGLSPDEAFEFKKIISDITKFTGNASDDATVNKALKQVYGNTKEKLNGALSGFKSSSGKDITKLNEKYADLTSAEIATIYRDKIMERSNLISLPQQIAGLGTAITAFISSGGQALPTILAGASAITIEKALASPAIKTRVAAWLAKTSPEERKRIFNIFPALKGIATKTYIGE